MVDAIKTTVNRLELMKGRSSENRQASAGAVRDVAAASGDSVTVSEAASPKAQTLLAQSPPVDSEAVSRIKAAIARGDYPIDVDRISEALMDAYRDMKA